MSNISIVPTYEITMTISWPLALDMYTLQAPRSEHSGVITVNGPVHAV